MTEGRRWRIGELATAAGLTVRTLHHFDAVRLVVPSERSATGHRRYTEPDVQRLYRVLALRQLGLPLDQVRRVLDDDGDRDGDGDLRMMIGRQLRHLDDQVQEQDRLRRRLTTLL